METYDCQSTTLYPKAQFHFQMAGSSNKALLEVCVEIPPLAEEAPLGFSSRLRERDLPTVVGMGINLYLKFGGLGFC